MVNQSLVAIFTGLGLGVVSWIYRKHGTSGQVIVILYICSLVATQWSMKSFFVSFPTLQYPFLLTSLHSMTQFLCSEAMLRRREFPSSFVAIVQELGWRNYLCVMGPVALVIALSICTNNASLMYIGMGLNSIVSSLTPVPTAILARLGGKQYSVNAWAGICVASSGGLILSTSIWRTAFSAPRTSLGVSFAFAALILRAAKTTVQDRLMNGDGSLVRKVAPLEMISLQAPLSFLVYLALSVFFEGSQPYKELWSLEQGHPLLFVQALGSAGLSAACAMALQGFGMWALKILGGPAMQIAGKLNVVITTSFAVAFLNEEVKLEEAVGGMFALAGAYIFETSLHSTPLEEKQNILDDPFNEEKQHLLGEHFNGKEIA